MFFDRVTAFGKRFFKNPQSAILLFIRNRMDNRADNKLSQDIALISTADISLLEAMILLARHESAQRTAPHKLGVVLERALLSNSEDEYENILQTVTQALAVEPNSILLVFVKATMLAKLENAPEAHEIVSAALLDSRTPEAIKHFGDAIAMKRTVALGKIWRVIDDIARNNMSWVNGSESKSNGYSELSFLGDYTFSSEGSFNVSMALLYVEPLLQGKTEEKFLDACQHIYNNAENLSDRLKVIHDIRRAGIRRIKSYHNTNAVALKLYELARPEWERLTHPLSAATRTQLGGVVKIISTLRQVIKIAERLDRQDDIKVLTGAVLALAKKPSGKRARWFAASILIETDPVNNLVDSKKLIDSIGDLPKAIVEIQHFLTWSLHAQEYEKAIKFFDKQPGKVKNHRCALIYVNLLQRVGRFADAAKIASLVNAAMLVRPQSMCPFTIWAVRRRTGELLFLAETSNYYSSVPQPSKPKGVIFLTARTIEQVRRMPLVVLLEWKRMGWAVIPIVEGLLPRQPTGIPKIDQYLGCLTLNRQLKPHALKSFTGIQSFLSDPENGKLTWRDIDLSHALWEEAAVNRRVYNVDYSCPILKQYLGQNIRWTELNAIVLKNLQQSMKSIDMKTGVLIAFNYRLPDSVFRFYCENYGDPEQFFCIHAANGYQNYFANFSTNVSTKGVIRNMTRHPETRSGSFPIPDKFESYFQSNKPNAEQILNKVRNVTKVKRSTEGQKTLPQDAKFTLARIRAWKASGGKVACAFGKVVCDSGVPYDGGAAHKNMKEWLNHSINAVINSDTLLLIKPHPHEHKEAIACFLNEYFFDLIETNHLPPNVILLGHRWFDINDLKDFVDLGLIYNGTTSVELGILGVPSVLCSHFAPIDYPVGHVTPKDKADYERYVRFEQPIDVSDDLQYRSACWIHYMSSNHITKDYRYHARPITNKSIYPPWWFKKDIQSYFAKGDENVAALAHSAFE